jgi:Ca2+-binding RTX toxin-like protein
MRHNFRPRLERLERRDTPSAVLGPNSRGVVTVFGDDMDPNVPVNDTIAVTDTGSTFTIDVNGTIYVVPDAGVTRIRVLAGNGDDSVTVDANVSIRTELFGHAGNDTLSGGSGQDLIAGDDGDDVLFGNDGDDYLSAGDGADFVRGGAGFDVMYATDFSDDDADEVERFFFYW